MRRRRAIGVKSDLHTAHLRHAAHLRHQRCGGVSVLAPVGTKERQAVTVRAPRLLQLPCAMLVQPHHRLQPAGVIEVRPLIREAQVCIDDAAADGLEVHHAGIRADVPRQPVSEIRIEVRPRGRLDGPVIEGALTRRHTAGMPRPGHLAAHDRDIRADMLAFEQRHPEMPGRQVPPIRLETAEHTGADTHAAQVRDRLAEHRELRRLDSVRGALDALRGAQPQLVVHPLLLRTPLIGVRILGGNAHLGRRRNLLEVLQSPGVGFAERHAVP